MSEHDESGKRTESGRANASRRTILRGVAAGSVVGLGGLGGVQAQETTPPEDEQDETPRFFEQGTEVGVQMVADGPLTAPTDFAVAEGDDRQFVADQTGELYVATEDGIRDEPFLDVSDRMVELGSFNGEYADPNQDYDERGLLGVEMHPEFETNGRFFVHYSAPPEEAEDMPDNWSHVEVLSEFQANDDGETADPDSEQRLLEIESPQYNHDSGPMAFGPDGYLYFPMGDGGGGNDDMYGHVDDWYDDNDGGNGQDVEENLMGDVLRIDVDSEGEDTPYGIPDDNPFAGDSDGRDEIYAYGFRNPFGISFDEDGRLFVADAGQDVFEEVDVVEQGGNYGWNVKEGTHCFSTEAPTDHPEECPDSEPDEEPYTGQQLQDPVVEYPHQYQGEWVGIVVVGGYVYEQDTVPDLQGKYVFGDWTKDPQREEPAGRLLAATEPDDGAETTPAETTPEETPAGKTTPQVEEEQVVPRDRLWDMEELVVAGSEDGTLDWFVRQFGRGSDGELYVLVSRRGVPEGDTGAVLQIVPPGEGDGSATMDEGAETTPAEETPEETTPEETPAGKTTPQVEEEETTPEEDEDDEE